MKKQSKQLSDLEWVALAKSNDKTRFNLTEVYRDKTCLVATDGHRLHLSNGLPEQTPSFLSGLDAEFPDYKQVMPKSTVDLFELNTDDREDLLRFLEAANSLVKKMSLGKFACVTIDRTDSSRLRVRALCNESARELPSLTLSYQSNVIPTIIDSFEPFTLRADYLADALKGFGVVRLCAENPKNELGARLLQSPTGRRKAIIMPMRDN